MSMTEQPSTNYAATDVSTSTANRHCGWCKAPVSHTLRHRQLETIAYVCTDHVVVLKGVLKRDEWMWEEAGAS